MYTRSAEQRKYILLYLTLTLLMLLLPQYSRGLLQQRNGCWLPLLVKICKFERVLPLKPQQRLDSVGVAWRVQTSGIVCYGTSQVSPNK